jgi:hypothetical protein
VGARAGRGAEYFEKIGFPVQFTTLTMHRKVRDRDASIERWRETWPKLRKRCKRACPEFHYATLPEKHKDGTVHFHLLETSGLAERWYKDNCASIGLGFMVDVQAVRNASRAVSYVTKYLTKSLQVDNWPTGFHRFRFSAQWPDIGSVETPSEQWRVFLSQQIFDDEMRYWYSLDFKIVNTRTGELSNA